MKINIKKTFVFLVFIILLVFFDQLTKYLTIIYLKGNDGISIIDNVFRLEYVENRGAAYGMLGGKRTFFIILTVILIPLMAMFIFRLEKVIDDFKGKKGKFAKKLLFLQYIVAALIAGAAGNFIDRLLRHYVVDFLYFELIDFPVFNVADCYVTIATVLLAIMLIIGISGDEFNTIFPGKKSDKNDIIKSEKSTDTVNNQKADR